MLRDLRYSLCWFTQTTLRYSKLIYEPVLIYSLGRLTLHHLMTFLNLENSVEVTYEGDE
jgi:hypothetical protein